MGKKILGLYVHHFWDQEFDISAAQGGFRIATHDILQGHFSITFNGSYISKDMYHLLHEEICHISCQERFEIIIQGWLPRIQNHGVLLRKSPITVKGYYISKRKEFTQADRDPFKTKLI